LTSCDGANFAFKEENQDIFDSNRKDNGFSLTVIADKFKSTLLIAMINMTGKNAKILFWPKCEDFA
jgi:hypothetical protein